MAWDDLDQELSDMFGEFSGAGRLESALFAAYQRKLASHRTPEWMAYRRWWRRTDKGRESTKRWNEARTERQRAKRLADPEGYRRHMKAIRDAVRADPARADHDRARDRRSYHARRARGWKPHVDRERKRAHDALYRERVKASPERLERKRAYAREWLRKKRASNPDFREAMRLRCEAWRRKNEAAAAEESAA